MTDQEMSAAIDALKAAVESRGIDVQHTALQRWTFYFDQPHWNAYIQERHPGNIKLNGTGPTAAAAIEQLSAAVAAWVPDVQRLSDVLGFTVAA